MSPRRSGRADGCGRAEALQLLDRKDNAHYGVIRVAVNEERKMIEWAGRLLADARAAVEA